MMMKEITLPAPSCVYPFIPTLALVEKMEKETGSLFTLAEKLVQKTIPLHDVIGILQLVYRDAGCVLPDDVLGDYLLRRAPVPPLSLLSDILLHILTPLQAAGAFEEAEESNLAGKPQAAGDSG